MILLTYSCSMILQRFWIQNFYDPHRSRRLYVSLCDGCGRLPQERLAGALSAALAAGAGALSAAQTWSVAQRGAKALVPWQRGGHRGGWEILGISW